MKNKRILLLVFLVALMFTLFLYASFGSFTIREVVGQACGLETVVPCIMHDVTKTIDILQENRLVAMIVTAGLFITSSVLLLRVLFKKA